MKTALRSPEVQFFLIIFATLLAVFFINRVQLFDPELLYLNGVFFVVLFFVSFLQMLYGLHVRTTNLQEEKHFLRMAAHQMRTPATAVTWMLDELKHHDMTDKEREDILKMGSVATKKFINIVDTFSTLSDVDFGRPEYEFTNIDLNEAVARAVFDSLPIAKQYHVSLHPIIQEEKLFFRADPVKFEIVLSNLIHNAIKYNKEGGSVTVRLRKNQALNRAEFIVEDTGIGISEEDKKQLFTLFFRSREAQKMNPTGTGLGLYLVKSILDRHHGTVSVVSREGQGTTFTVQLPLVR